MKLTMSTSGMIVITLFSILMIWDGISVYFLGGVQSSVSRAIIHLTGFNPFGFYAGTVCGHLFTNMWPSTERLKAAWENFLVDEARGGEWPALIELKAAIDEIVNQDHGPLRYFRRKK